MKHIVKVMLAMIFLAALHQKELQAQDPSDIYTGEVNPVCEKGVTRPITLPAFADSVEQGKVSFFQNGLTNKEWAQMVCDGFNYRAAPRLKMEAITQGQLMTMLHDKEHCKLEWVDLSKEYYLNSGTKANPTADLVWVKLKEDLRGVQAIVYTSPVNGEKAVLAKWTSCGGNPVCDLHQAKPETPTTPEAVAKTDTVRSESASGDATATATASVGNINIYNQIPQGAQLPPNCGYYPGQSMYCVPQQACGPFFGIQIAFQFSFGGQNYNAYGPSPVVQQVVNNYTTNNYYSSTTNNYNYTYNIITPPSDTTTTASGSGSDGNDGGSDGGDSGGSSSDGNDGGADGNDGGGFAQTDGNSDGSGNKSAISRTPINPMNGTQISEISSGNSLTRADVKPLSSNAGTLSQGSSIPRGDIQPLNLTHANTGTMTTPISRSDIQPMNANSMGNQNSSNILQSGSGTYVQMGDQQVHIISAGTNGYSNAVASGQMTTMNGHNVSIVPATAYNGTNGTAMNYQQGNQLYASYANQAGSTALQNNGYTNSGYTLANSVPVQSNFTQGGNHYAALNPNLGNMVNMGNTFMPASVTTGNNANAPLMTTLPTRQTMFANAPAQLQTRNSAGNSSVLQKGILKF